MYPLNITQPLGIWSIMATIRWCPIFPKWDSYQPLHKHRKGFMSHSFLMFGQENHRCKLPASCSKSRWKILARGFQEIISMTSQKNLRNRALTVAQAGRAEQWSGVNMGQPAASTNLFDHWSTNSWGKMSSEDPVNWCKLIFGTPFWSFMLPSGYVKIAIENGPVEILSFPIKNGDFP